MQTYKACGVPIAALSPSNATSCIVERAIQQRRMEVHLCNAYTLSLVDRDRELRGALSRADLNLPDGTPVAWLGRHLGIREPVRGPTLVGDVAAAGVEAGLRHYFYGGKPGVAQEMVTGLTKHVPPLQVSGTESPPFRDLNSAEIRDLAGRIKGLNSHVVWIGLGTPRQDYLVPRLAALLDMPVVPVGAAFDFWAGRVREAPAFLRGSGLEWVYRLASEPRRLWRRYLLGNPRFVFSAAKHSWSGRREGS